jgi:Amidohydrolase family
MNEGRRTRRIFFWMHNCAMGDQCYNQGGGYESPRSFQWIFRGNIVVPTSNPFVFGASSCATTTDSNDEAIADTPTVTMKNTPMASADDDDDDTSSVVWLGPGLKLLLDHVVAVDEIGIIRHVSPTQSFCSSYKESTPSCSISEFLTTLVPTVQHVVELSSYEFLCPGLIDLHIHAPQYAFTGTATDRPLLGPHGWLETFTFPAERRLATDAALAEHVYQSVVQTTLRHGTTTAVYFATLDLEPCQVLVNAAMQHDQRALIGKVCMDRHAPDTYFQTTEQNITETEALIHYIHDRAGQRPQRSQRSRQVPSATDGETTTTKTRLPLILPLVTPRFIPTCTPQLLSALGGMAARYDCHVTSHISESRDEVAFVQYLDTHVDNSSTTNSNDNVVARSDADIFDAHHLLTRHCALPTVQFLLCRQYTAVSTVAARWQSRGIGYRCGWGLSSVHVAFGSHGRSCVTCAAATARSAGGTNQSNHWDRTGQNGASDGYGESIRAREWQRREQCSLGLQTRILLGNLGWGRSFGFARPYWHSGGWYGI